MPDVGHETLLPEYIAAEGGFTSELAHVLAGHELPDVGHKTLLPNTLLQRVGSLVSLSML